MMRLLPLLSSALVLALSGTSFAQDWNEFSSREDRFTIIFPGQPEISETTWVSQYGAILPARIYSGRQGSGHYTVTVVDYNPIERLLSERSRTLPALDLAGPRVRAWLLEDRRARRGGLCCGQVPAAGWQGRASFV
jgi:hypothetical protein